MGHVLDTNSCFLGTIRYVLDTHGRCWTQLGECWTQHLLHEAVEERDDLDQLIEPRVPGPVLPFRFEVSVSGFEVVWGVGLGFRV